MITAIGMTEPNCGSDLKALLTTAEDKGDHYVKWTKNIYH
jgi:alkylation response protein AidB-like acyl-CoA dehydrogenase